MLFSDDCQAGNGFFDAVNAAAVLRDRVACTLDLSRARFTAQLRHQFVDLAETGGADRVAL